MSMWEGVQKAISIRERSGLEDFMDVHVYPNYPMDGVDRRIFEETPGHRNCRKIRQGHRIHIFMSRWDPDTSKDDFYRFARAAYLQSQKPIIIHIPKDRDWLIGRVKEVMGNSAPSRVVYKIITEKRSTKTRFMYNQCSARLRGKHLEYVRVYQEYSWFEDRVIMSWVEFDLSRPKDDLGEGIIMHCKSY